MPPDQVVKTLCTLLLKDSDPLVRCSAALALGRLGTTNPVIENALCYAAGHDDNPTVRSQAALAVSQLYSRSQVLDPLPNLLKNISEPSAEPQTKVQMTFNAPVTGATGSVESDVNVNPQPLPEANNPENQKS